MKALEFNTKLKNNTIQIPEDMKTAFKSSRNKNVRVIVLIDENDANDEKEFKNLAAQQFLNGYADSDSVYDNY
ncbi:MAG: hypothetical protein WCJ72_18240 [Chryseobacterium sp.]